MNLMLFFVPMYDSYSETKALFLTILNIKFTTRILFFHWFAGIKVNKHVTLFAVTLTQGLLVKCNQSNGCMWMRE
jgi:hypothetical protein